MHKESSIICLANQISKQFSTSFFFYINTASKTRNSTTKRFYLARYTLFVSAKHRKRKLKQFSEPRLN
ncbi:unnamed protein product [Rotaria magnacalcarata]